ncbi:MAG: hypothetical protein R3E68_04060 [Burkholderiaceae bacterium]
MRAFIETAGRRAGSTITVSLPSSDSLSRFLAHFGFQEQRRLFMRPNPGRCAT